MDKRKVGFLEKIKLFSIFVITTFIILYGGYKVFFTCVKNAQEAKENEILKRADTTFCVVKEVGYLKMLTCWYEYYVAGKTYYGRTGACSNSVKEGEEFMVIYDSLNPKEHFDLFEFPHLNSDLKSDTICAEVITQDDQDVLFRFNVGNTEFEKRQRTKRLGKIYDIGEFYKYYYKSSDPEIGYSKNEKCD